MNPQAIMTPGGIADQFTRGLSGVAQAFADRSRIDREAQRDAFSQARQLEQEQMARDAFARQGDWRQQEIDRQNTLDAIVAEKRAYDQQISAAELFSKGITPPGRDLVTQLNPTEQSAIGAFYRARDDKEQARNDANAKTFANTYGKVDQPKMVWGADPITGEPVRMVDEPGVERPAPIPRPPRAESQLDRMRIDEALSKIEKKLTYDAEDMFPDHDNGWVTTDEDRAAQLAIEAKRRNYVVNELAKKRAEYMGATSALTGSAGQQTRPSFSSFILNRKPE
jgi:hypothetical protein